MSADETVLGYRANVVIGSTTFNVTGGTVGANAEVVDTSDSESGQFVTNKGGKRSASVSFNFNIADDVDPHLSPLSINEGDEIVVYIYPRGLVEDELYFWYFPIVVVGSYQDSFQSTGGMVTGQFSGQSSGVFYRPGELPD